MGSKESNQIYRFVVRPLAKNDPRSSGYLADAHSLGLHQVQEIACQDLYFVRGELNQRQLNQLADQLLHDPVTQQVEAALLKLPCEGQTMGEEALPPPPGRGNCRSGFTPRSYRPGSRTNSPLSQNDQHQQHKRCLNRATFCC